MKKVDLGFTLKHLDGRDILITGTQDVAHAGWYVSQSLLSRSGTPDFIKFYDWAVKFNNKEVLELDEQDFKKLYELVRTVDNLTVLVKAPIIRYLDSLK